MQVYLGMPLIILACRCLASRGNGSDSSTGSGDSGELVAAAPRLHETGTGIKVDGWWPWVTDRADNG